MEVEIVNGTIIEAQTEVIVNAWNRNIIPWFLLLPQGVSGEIKRKAGFQPFNELLKFGPMRLGSARVTLAGKLQYKAIIHVAGINMFWRASEKSIRNSVQSAIKAAEEHGFTSIAFPIIGAGSGGFAQESALTIMLDEFEGIHSSVKAIIIRFQK